MEFLSIAFPGLAAVMLLGFFARRVQRRQALSCERRAQQLLGEAIRQGI
jgi:hypothetical protein